MRFTFGMADAEAATYLGSSTAATGSPGRPPPSSSKGSSGTGFFITRQGHILTNAHVVNGCKGIAVQQPGSNEAPANVVATDKQNDLALLQASTPAPAIATLRGGPLLDMTGAVVGITSESLSTNSAARRYGATPQNANFAIKTEVVRTFLSTTSVSAESSAGGRELSAADVGDRAFTVHVVCKR